jgi:hypothetical protein
MRVRQIAATLLLISATVGAMVAIAAILVGGAGEFGGREIVALAAVLVCAGGSIVAMASLAAWQLPSAWLVSRLGVTSAIAAMATILVGALIEPSWDPFWQVFATTAILAIAGGHGSMVSLAKLPLKHQWVRVLTLWTDALLVVALLVLVWREPGRQRITTVLAIADSALTFAVVLLHAMNRFAPMSGCIGEVRFGPRCGKRLWHPAGELRCHHCEERFLIELRPASELSSAVARTKSNDR